ncbi:MAG: haloacid dehalogenase-like hydrolase [Anaerolineaceae bacterium]|jgi:hypothetical protein
MVKRSLDANASDFAAMTARELVESIRLSEGRTVAAEVVVTVQPLIDKVSNVELAAGMGADILLLNLYDVTAPQVYGFPSEGVDNEPASFGSVPAGKGVTLEKVKAWIGRPVGLNLEPIENPAAVTTSGRLATAENAKAAVEQGADFICITGNPYTGVTVHGVHRALAEVRAAVGDKVMLLAGKVHAAGKAEPAMNTDDIRAFAAEGADGILLPVPGTIPGITVDIVHALVDAAHAAGLLVMNCIDTSQEGASVSTIEQMALWSKMTGADIHHIGDAGTIGIAVPENIYAWSLTLRGRRHTWHRMTASLRR